MREGDEAVRPFVVTRTFSPRAIRRMPSSTSVFQWLFPFGRGQQNECNIGPGGPGDPGEHLLDNSAAFRYGLVPECGIDLVSTTAPSCCGWWHRRSDARFVACG